MAPIVTPGMATTYNLNNYQGELYHLSPFETPLLSAIGGMTGGEDNGSVIDYWGTEENESPEQRAALEGADPLYSAVGRGQSSNVKQIYQYGFSVSYTKQAAVGDLAADSLRVEGTNGVRDEISRQRMLKMRKMATDVEYTFLNGVYSNPDSNTAPRKTRGILTAITTNVITASGAALNKGHLDDLARVMADGNAMLTSPVLMMNSWQRQGVSNVYGYAPQSRTYGGLSIETIETDFGIFGVTYNRWMPTDTIALIDLAYLTPTHLAIPGKGTVFVEELAHTGAAWNFQLYGEIGLKYGPENWHGKITGLATS